MLKQKSSVSPFRPNNRSIRPRSSGAPLNRKPATSAIGVIISSLQQNVKDLKSCYHLREGNGAGRTDKSQKGFRVKRTLVRNSSQSNLNPKGEKSEHDVFQIRNQYLRVHGKLTNSIIELYQFYRKIQEKREKSTRILASMEISNGGQSASGGKESLLKHSQLFNHRESSRRDPQEHRIDEPSNKIEQATHKIDEASENSHQIDPQPAKPKREKTSELASELISKGCYNIMNIANLLNCKKYKLTKEKQDSFKRPKEKPTHPHQQIAIGRPNGENNINVGNHLNPSSMGGSKPIQKAKGEELEKQQLQFVRSPERNNRPDFSFKKLQEPMLSNTKSFDCSSISKYEKDVERKAFEQSSVQKDTAKKEQLKKDQVIEKPKQALLELEESPILAKNGKDFQKSKYYVKPIPQKGGVSEKSISLSSTSRIIDLDSVPFDL